MSENELGLFLRSRRESIDPAAVGLPAGSRRRTPGLRRSEVAMLAGVSVEYVTRLEQGRDRHPSPPVLGALADVLRLTGNDRVHLYRLTKGAGATFPCRAGLTPSRVLRPTLRALLERLEPALAVLVNHLGDLVARTETFDAFARPLGLLETDPPNLLRYVLTSPRARTVFPEWPAVADHWVATLKEGPFRADPYVAAVADELSVIAGDEFTSRVATVPGVPAPTGVLRVAHPELGPLDLAYESLELPADDSLRLLVYLPADSATAHVLEGPATHPPLRLVSG
ncbi:transcriptional regulator [Paractinoplanes abujensis]|uniref:Transcriptional regulator with XRE-family HTH domain n=1 Tax=Paractinoplanes abujensis TaxID=882441 RepID=A0A7W7G1G2_9ACTN|nr:helix-turn-helix transcriptional regulator [Actinoplanes abujensis]MBB4690581.1 transcriptional regulator with XRE-family HTH domain [Actinoplanes abujensis]GID18005.1 transcriptional regulator [Actinoplanes abujensis]